MNCNSPQEEECFIALQHRDSLSKSKEGVGKVENHWLSGTTHVSIASNLKISSKSCHGQWNAIAAEVPITSSYPLCRSACGRTTLFAQWLRWTLYDLVSLSHSLHSLVCSLSDADGISGWHVILFGHFLYVSLTSLALSLGFVLRVVLIIGTLVYFSTFPLLNFRSEEVARCNECNRPRDLDDPYTRLYLSLDL